MADFKTHVTFSSVLGCGYAFAGMTAGMNMSTSIVAGGLCGLSGMLPDVDSDSGIPRRETMSFAAAIVPMLLVDRFQEYDLTYDQMVLATAGLYFGIRFGLAKLIGEFSVHRGMWHSIPAALIFAGLAFLITGTEDLTEKYFKAFAVFLGTMSHLVLDEVYSVDTRGVIPKFKKSFGSAVKFWGKSPWANFSTYAKLAAVAVAIFGDVSVLARLREKHPAAVEVAESAIGRARELAGSVAAEVQGAAPQAQPPAWGPTPQPQQAYAPPAGQTGGWPQPNYQPPAYPQQPTYQQPAPQQQYAPISPPQGGFGPNNGGYQPTPRYNYPPAAQNGGWNQR